MPLLQDGQEKSFSQMMRESTMQGLSNIIGKSGTEAVFFKFGLKDRIMNPKAFHEAMVSAFKEPGAILLEKMIVKEFYRMIYEQFDQSLPFNFEREFDLAKSLFLKRGVLV
jgi:hypothetical protein